MVSFEERVAAEIPALRRYARAITRDRDRAEDLLQDTIERALAKRIRFRPPRKLRTWLFRIMHKLFVNHMRSRTRQMRVLDEDVDEKEQNIEPSQIARVEVMETLNAFNRLPAEQREALLLVAVEGLSYSEAAAILQIPVGTVLSRVARARQALHDREVTLH